MAFIYLFKLKFLPWHFHVRGDMHFESLDYPHSHVSVMFYTRFLTHGQAKHTCINVDASYCE